MCQLGCHSTGCISKVEELGRLKPACECAHVSVSIRAVQSVFYHTAMGNAVGIKIETWESQYKLKSVNSTTLCGN